VPVLQVGGQVVTFLTEHRGNPIPSPALFNPIGERFRAAVGRFATAHGIPVVRFEKDQRKAEVMRPYLEAAARDGVSRVVAIGVAQEYQRVVCGYDRGRSDGQPGPPRYAFEKADRRVSCCDFYVWDTEFGPGFIKICSYFPYPAKVWVNGHEWAKQQARMAGIGFAERPTGSPPAMTRLGCRRFVTGSARPTCRRSSTAGSRSSPPHWTTAIGLRATGGSCRCARSRSPAPWSWTSPAAPGRSLRRWWPTTSASAGPTRSR